MAYEDAKMRRPAFEYKVNLNTVLLALGLLAVGVGWGVTWSAARKDIDQNARDIKTSQADIDALQADVRANTMLNTNLQFRTTSLESGLQGAIANQRDADKNLNQLTSDVRVIKEIVQRLDPATGR